MRIPIADFTLEADARLRSGAAAAVLCHPHPAFGGRMDTPLVLALADALSMRGLSTLRFNFRGLGGSGGTPTGGAREHEDVAAAVGWMVAAGACRVALVGYSFGALMAARALAGGAPVQAFAAVGFPTTILGSDVERLADVDAALARRLPSLFISGDQDHFCELDRIRSWVDGRDWARLEALPGRGHFFVGAEADALSDTVADFVAGAL